MVSSTIDHMAAVTALIAATLIFIGLFSQTIQTAVIYQQHKALSNKANDILDTLLLNPGIPVNWGQTDGLPTGFGIQDPEFTQYRLSSYSLMRLQSSVGTSVYYPVTGEYYSNVTVGDRNFLLVPYSLSVNYSTAAKLLGITNAYGFQLSLNPIVSVSIQEISAANPLTLRLGVSGVGSALSYATINYCFLKVLGSGPGTPTYDISFNTIEADASGSATLNIPNVVATDAYALIAYARLGGLVGIGYRERTGNSQYIIPFVDSIEEGRIQLAHSYNVHEDQDPESAVFLTATYVLLAEDYTLREMPIIEQKELVVYGHGADKTYVNVTIPTHSPGILVIPYKSNNVDGITLMPWGMSAMAFPVVFGGDSSKQEWVATDMRQVTVGGITYQARLALWSLEGYQVNE
jgi:hypothetical protein